MTEVFPDGADDSLTDASQFESLQRQLSETVASADLHRLRRQLLDIRRLLKSKKDISQRLQKWQKAVKRSQQLVEKRQNNLPPISYPDLPVSTRSEEILELIKHNQVVVIAGETGSGKTTQLPKICLQAGRGVKGIIGHTQPRRIAARTVAQRIADELNSPLGDIVGYQVRFSDQSSTSTQVKLMTDGILLAEIQ
ncbi:MAG: ATP-dependent RNA helicase HrpA, partial [Porticoccaceae bacterium]